MSKGPYHDRMDGLCHAICERFADDEEVKHDSLVWFVKTEILVKRIGQDTLPKAKGGSGRRRLEKEEVDFLQDVNSFCDNLGIPRMFATKKDGRPDPKSVIPFCQGYVRER